MPGPQGAAEPARFVLLGLLLAGPAHGYDLARSFGPGSGLGEVIHLTPSHLYGLLNRLDRDGLIAGERVDAFYPPRHVYRLTEAGRGAVMRWLDEPVRHPRDMRIDFPLKLYLALAVDPGRATDLIERQRAVFQAYVEQLETLRVPESGPDGRWIILMRRARIGRARAALEWLDLCADLQPMAL